MEVGTCGNPRTCPSTFCQQPEHTAWVANVKAANEWRKCRLWNHSEMGFMMIGISLKPSGVTSLSKSLLCLNVNSASCGSLP